MIEDFSSQSSDRNESVENNIVDTISALMSEEHTVLSAIMDNEKIKSLDSKDRTMLRSTIRTRTSDIREKVGKEIAKIIVGKDPKDPTTKTILAEVIRNYSERLKSVAQDACSEFFDGDM